MLLLLSLKPQIASSTAVLTEFVLNAKTQRVRILSIMCYTTRFDIKLVPLQLMRQLIYASLQ